MSMVLEMPVMTTSAAERAQLLPERLHAAYQDLFALLKQQYRFADDARIFAFFAPAQLTDSRFARGKSGRFADLW